MDPIDDPIAKAEEIREKQSRELALDLAPDAVRVLGKLMKGRKMPGDQIPTPMVMRQAAMDILHQAHGRPEQRNPSVLGGEAGRSGLTVVINQFGSSLTREIPVGGGQVLDALELAQQIREREGVPIED
jgi:hypothetical protein